MSRSYQSLREASEHYEVGVKLDTLQATNPKRGESVVVFQLSELPLDHDPPRVEVPEPFGMAWDARNIRPPIASGRAT